MDSFTAYLVSNEGADSCKNNTNYRFSNSFPVQTEDMSTYEVALQSLTYHDKYKFESDPKPIVEAPKPVQNFLICNVEITEYEQIVGS